VITVKQLRDEEWLVRRVDRATDGGWLLACDGISDLVRGQTALFLTSLEDAIEVLDPAKTKLEPDTSPTYNASVLFLESMRRRSVANDERIHLGHRGVMNLVPYQLDPALQALQEPFLPSGDLPSCLQSVLGSPFPGQQSSGTAA